MDPPIRERQAALMSLEEAAALLGLPPTNLLLWDHHYGDELGLPRDLAGRPLFSGEHLQKLREIDRLIRLDRQPPEEVRRRLSRTRPARGVSNGVAGRAGAGAVWAEAPAVPERAREPGWGEAASRHETPAAAAAAERWTASLEHLRDDVAYLLEENRALQELVGRLITYIEGIAHELRSAREGADSEVKMNGRSHGVVRKPENQENKKSPQGVRAWIPKAIEEQQDERRPSDE